MPTAPEGATPARLGVFGGTFDPPHRGHVAVAIAVADTLRLDRLLWIPAGIPPHKSPVGLTDAPLRLEMTRAAAVADARFLVSDLETGRPGPSYTVDTLRALRGSYPDAEIFLALGADQVRALASSWREPSAILEMATLAVIDRSGDAAEPHASRIAGAEHPVHVALPRIDVSSTEVRRRVRLGQPIDDLVPDGVRTVIEREGLYRS